MSTSVTFNGVSYTVPAIADASWGTNVSNYLIAISTGCLQKTGGAFTLSTADIDFGGVYGLKALYFKSKTANIASAGVIELAKTDTIGWRNNANGADLALGINASDLVTFNSIALADISTAQTFTNKSMSGSANTFTNMPSSAITGTLGADHGGTGVANNVASTLTISGSFATTLTVTGATGVTLPTSGTLATLSNKLSAFAATTSAELATVISDETGTGLLVFATTPTLTTPVLGVATATSINKMAITAPATSSTLAVADGKTATISNTLTLAGTDGNTMTFPSGSSTVMTLASADTITGVKTFNSGKLAATNIINGSGTVTMNSTGTMTVPGATDTLVGKATTDAFTNKDYQGGTASNTSRFTTPSAAKATLDGLTRKAATLVYGTDTLVLYADNGTSLVPVGSGGTGEVNLILNPNDQYATWATTASGPTATTTLTAGNLPLNTVAGISTAIQMTSNSAAQTEASNYFGYAFTTPQTLGSKLKIDLWMVPGSNFLSGEWSVSIYAGSTRQTLSTDSSGVTYLPNASGKFTTTFDALASTAYTLRFARPVNAGTNAAVLNVNGIVVGPGVQPQGAAVSQWTSFTPTGSWSTNTTYTGNYRRVGDSMDFAVKLAIAGAPTSANLTLNVPLGLTIDTTKWPGATDAEDYTRGVVTIFDTSAGAAGEFNGCVSYASTTSLSIRVSKADATYLVVGTAVTQAVPMTFASGDLIHIVASIPIAEWSTSGTVNVVQNDVEYVSNSSTTDANDTTSFAYGPLGSVVPTVVASATTASRDKRVQFQTPIQVTDQIVIEVQTNGTGSWLEIPGEPSYQSFMYQGGSAYGIGYTQVSATQVDVNFYRGGRLSSNATYAGAGASYPRNAADRWRLRKIAGGQAVGFSQGTTTALGLVRAGTVPGDVSGSSSAAGYMGEKITGTIQNSGASYSNGTLKNIASIALTAGKWMIFPQAQITVGTGLGAASLFEWGVSTTNSAMDSGWLWRTPAILGSDNYLPPTARYVDISASATYYMNMNVTFASGSCSNAAATTMFAVRIA